MTVLLALLVSLLPSAHAAEAAVDVDDCSVASPSPVSRILTCASLVVAQDGPIQGPTAVQARQAMLDNVGLELGPERVLGDGSTRAHVLEQGGKPAMLLVAEDRPRGARLTYCIDRGAGLDTCDTALVRVLGNGFPPPTAAPGGTVEVAGRTLTVPAGCSIEGPEAARFSRCSDGTMASWVLGTGRTDTDMDAAVTQMGDRLKSMLTGDVQAVETTMPCTVLGQATSCRKVSVAQMHSWTGWVDVAGARVLVNCANTAADGLPPVCEGSLALGAP